MPILLSCPGCGTRLNAPDSAAGKSVKCPRCQSTARVPAPGSDDLDSRPRKRRPDDDEADPRPRRRKAKKKGGVPAWVFVAGGGGLLLLAAAAVVVAVLRFAGGGGTDGGGGGGGGLGGLVGTVAGSAPVGPPPGFSEVRDPEGGFRVYLPGTLRKGVISINGREVRDGSQTAWAGAVPGTDNNVKARSYREPSGLSPEELWETLSRYHGLVADKGIVIESKTPITLGGKPALAVRLRDKDAAPAEPHQLRPLPPNATPEQRRQREEAEELMRKTEEVRARSNAARARREVHYIVSDGTRVILLHLEWKGEFPSEATLKTVTASFEFL
jgi:hypothetical protein